MGNARAYIVVDADWPVIAHAAPPTEPPKMPAHVTVRAHRDGRVLVYSAADYFGSPLYAGELTTQVNLVDAIFRVGRATGMPHAILQEVVNQLPGEELV